MKDNKHTINVTEQIKKYEDVEIVTLIYIKYNNHTFLMNHHFLMSLTLLQF
jgi:hypothetical protein